jgi:hypothetical protein
MKYMPFFYCNTVEHANVTTLKNLKLFSSKQNYSYLVQYFISPIAVDCPSYSGFVTLALSYAELTPTPAVTVRSWGRKKAFLQKELTLKKWTSVKFLETHNERKAAEAFGISKT